MAAGLMPLLPKGSAGEGLISGLGDRRCCSTPPQPPAGTFRLGWQRPSPVKEISLPEMLLRIAGRVAAVSGVIALLIWVTWVMLDVQNMQSGFTLP